MEPLKLEFLTQASVALAVLQDDINAIRRNLNCPCAESPRRHASTPQPLEEELHIHVVGA